MKKIVGVSFKDNGKVYYFLPNDLILKKNITVIVETGNGLQFGKVVLENFDLEESKILYELKPIVRIASKFDFKNHLKNINDAKEALDKCRKMIVDEKLSMNVISSEFNFDRSKLIFKFISDDRIDFRNLVKKLASIYKTRIEMIQVGTRDKAREISGVGICGCKLCCSRFLKDLDSVSINMAKCQNLSLNPTKINGVCGRLMCCLKYENDNYRECRKCMPKIGDKVETEFGIGEVESLDILNKKYKVNVENYGLVEMSSSCGKK